MKLFKWVSLQPVLLEGEGAMSPSSFQVGGSCGAGTIAEIEKTTLGVVVRRKEEQCKDIVLDGPGYGFPLDKQRQEPAQLKGAR